MTKTQTTLPNGMAEKDKRALMARLSRIEGQVRGIRDLIDQEKDCELIAQQLAAVRGALQKAFSQMVACAMKHQLFNQQDDVPDEEKIERMSQILSKYG